MEITKQHKEILKNRIKSGEHIKVNNIEFFIMDNVYYVTSKKYTREIMGNYSSMDAPPLNYSYSSKYERVSENRFYSLLYKLYETYILIKRIKEDKEKCKW